MKYRIREEMVSFRSGESPVRRTYETGMIEDEKRQEMFVLNLYPHKEYQSLDGFGGALTEGSASLLLGLSKEKRREVLEALYGKQGLRYNQVRLPIDSSDFSTRPFCQAVFGGKKASPFLSVDKKLVMPLLREIQEVRGGEDLSLLFSPWSPPQEMKDTGQRNGGGHLLKECYGAYAAYLAEYLSLYKKAGIPVWAITVQNEPLAVQTWDSCEYSPQEEKEFLREYLYPALGAAGLSEVKIFIWDHNKERVYERTRDIMDETTASMVAGVAFHWYSGDHFETLGLVREDYPELQLIHSEGCVELLREDIPSGTNVDQALRYAHDIIGDLNHGMNRWFDWNLLLDPVGGPNHVGNYCAAPIHCDVEKDLYWKNDTYEAIAQFSRFILPGAKRIASSSFSKDVEVTAAKNPDGSLVIVAMNTGEKDMWAFLRLCGKVARVFLPAKGIAAINIECSEG